jgi:autotransporter-associated beta strand protein
LLLGSEHANATVDFQNPINLGASGITRTIRAVKGSGSVAVDAKLSGILSGSASFTKVGDGRLRLSAVNSFTGATLISEGILEIGATGRINSTSGVTIDGTTAEFKYNSTTALTQPITFNQGTISGTGTIATAVTVAANDVISPGNSPGIQAYTSLHAWAPGGTYAWELNALTGSAGDQWDLVNVSSGTFSLSGLAPTPGNKFILDLITLNSDDVPGQLVNPYDGGSFTFAITSYDPANFLLPDGFSNTAGQDLTSLFTINLGNWQGPQPQASNISVKINSTATGIDLVIVPEPGAIALAGIGIAAAAWSRRRRK